MIQILISGFGKVRGAQTFKAMANLQPGSSFLELARDPADAATADWADAADAAPDAPEATDEAWGCGPQLRPGLQI